MRKHRLCVIRKQGNQYRCWIFMGELSSEETEQDGTYTVYLNLEAGSVEDILFLSEHGGGNG